MDPVCAPKEMTDAQRKFLREAAHIIRSKTFTWTASPQGHEYWSDVCYKLEQLAETKDPKAETHAKIAVLRKQIEELERTL